jgi:hypothetical protein
VIENESLGADYSLLKLGENRAQSGGKGEIEKIF